MPRACPVVLTITTTPQQELRIKDATGSSRRVSRFLAVFSEKGAL